MAHLVPLCRSRLVARVRRPGPRLVPGRPGVPVRGGQRSQRHPHAFRGSSRRRRRSGDRRAGARGRSGRPGHGPGPQTKRSLLDPRGLRLDHGRGADHHRSRLSAPARRGLRATRPGRRSVRLASQCQPERHPSLAGCQPAHLPARGGSLGRNRPGVQAADPGTVRVLRARRRTHRTDHSGGRDALGGVGHRRGGRRPAPVRPDPVRVGGGDPARHHRGVPPRGSGHGAVVGGCGTGHAGGGRGHPHARPGSSLGRDLPSMDPPSGGKAGFLCGCPSSRPPWYRCW
jgi:hypothetical protein